MTTTEAMPETRRPASRTASPAARGRSSSRGGIARFVYHPWTRRVGGGIIGLALGALLGFYLTVTVFVAQARAGDYLYSFDDVMAVRWEALPTVLGIVAGTVLGQRSLRTVLVLAGFMVVGALVFTVPGWFAGGALWEGESGAWAGAQLASGVGMLVGAGIAGYRAFRRES